MRYPEYLSDYLVMSFLHLVSFLTNFEHFLSFQLTEVAACVSYLVKDAMHLTCYLRTSFDYRPCAPANTFF